MLRVVAPVDHSYEVPSDEVSTTSSPSQIDSDPSAVIVGWAGRALTVNVAAAD